MTNLVRTRDWWPLNDAPSRPEVATIRTARLDLGALTLWLDDQAAGYTCTSLDLGYPTVRSVSWNRPDQSGVDDQTVYFGERGVTANITAWMGSDMTVDDIASLFGPFMVASARPVLTYTRHSDVGGERSLTLRPADFSSAMTSIGIRTIQLSFVAPDPIAYGLEEETVAFAGSSYLPGREYDLVYLDEIVPGEGWATWDDEAVTWDDLGFDWVGDPDDVVPWGRSYDLVHDRTFPPLPRGWPWIGRHYPPGGQVPTSGLIENRGDVAVQPLLRVHGPITRPEVSGTYADTGRSWRIVTRGSFIIDSDHYVDMDTASRTLTEYAHGAQVGTPVIQQVDWMATIWPLVPARSSSTLRLTGGTTSELTQVHAYWRSGFLL